MACSTQHSDSGESRTNNPSIPSPNAHVLSQILVVICNNAIQHFIFFPASLFCPLLLSSGNMFLQYGPRSKGSSQIRVHIVCLLKQGYRYHKLRKTFSKFYRRYYDLISKFQIGLKSLSCQGLLEPDFYNDLVYKLKKIVGSNNFAAQFIKIISYYKKIGYNINVLQQTACLVVNPCKK